MEKFSVEQLLKFFGWGGGGGGGGVKFKIFWVGGFIGISILVVVLIKNLKLDGWSP